MSVLYGGDPDALERLALEVQRAARRLAEMRRRVPAGIAVRILEVEQWLSGAERDLRRRQRLLAQLALVGAGRTVEWGGLGVLGVGMEFDRYTDATAQLIVRTAHDAARQAGPVGPMLDDGAAVAGRALEAWGHGVLRSAEREAHLLSIVGARLVKYSGR